MSEAGAAARHTKLMQAMGSKSGEWDPMPPAQYEAFMDVSQPEENRVWGAIAKRCVGRGDDGTRSPSCRERNGRKTKNRDIATELDMHDSQVSEALTRLEKQGKIRRTQDGSIWFRADAPAPNLEQTPEANKTQKFHCTVKLSSWEELHLKELRERDEKVFRATAARLIAAEEWGAKIKADAIAWAREREAEARLEVFTESGYTKAEPRGAKRKRPATDPDRFTLEQSFPHFTVQNYPNPEETGLDFTVQDGFLAVNTKGKNGVQNPYPYGPEVQSSESASLSQGKVTAKPETSEAELKREAQRAEIKTEINTRLQRAKLTTLGAVQVDVGTVNTMANDLLRLRTAGEVKQVLDVLEERAREIKTGKRVADGWGYLVKTVRGEVEKLLPADLKTQISTAAAGKGM